MAAKPRLAIVGPGNLGTALALELSRAGYKISYVVGRGSSMGKARRLSRQVGARVPTNPADVDADVIWFCVPDSEIGRAARAWAKASSGKARIALHSSGAFTSDELAPLRRVGYAVASVHPLMTFVRGSRPELAGVPFAIEGEGAATRLARVIVRTLGGRPYSIRKKEKAAYHAWGTFASPLLTSLLAATERVAGLAGVKRREVRQRMMPILRQTLENYAQHGAAGAFSGPIVRGDVGTVKKHLKVLRRAPALAEVYVALARAALQDLPVENGEAIKRVLRCARKPGSRAGDSERNKTFKRGGREDHPKRAEKIAG